MICKIKCFFCAFLAFLLVFTGLAVSAAETSNACVIKADGELRPQLTDDNIYTYRKVDSISVSSEAGIYGIYIKYDRMPPAFTVVADGLALPDNNTGYLHHFLKLNGEREVVISYDGGAFVADVFAFETEDTPSWVQKWEELENADLMVCPTHSDDDQLYFSGMIPWSVAEGYRVQVVYFTNHWNTHDRPHELLDGLWTCGVKYYPVISEFPDLYCLSLEEADAAFGGAGYKERDFTEFYVGLFDRYKPLVVAYHDVDGEYGHGAHMLNTRTIMSAIETAAERGVWDVPKTYVHLWKENPVVFDWDKPLDFFDGKSAFNVSQEAFGCHKSQHRFSSLYNWIYGTEGFPIDKAAQIGSYSPCRYGLYRTTVGTDTEINGLFENLVSYGERRKQKELTERAACLSADAVRGRLLERYAPKSHYLPAVRQPIGEMPEVEKPIESLAVTTKSDKTADGVGLLPWLLPAALVTALVVFAAAYKRRKG